MFRLNETPQTRQYRKKKSDIIGTRYHMSYTMTILNIAGTDSFADGVYIYHMKENNKTNGMSLQIEKKQVKNTHLFGKAVLKWFWGIG